MKTLAASNQKDKLKTKTSYLKNAVEAVALAVHAELSEETELGVFEQNLLDLCNEIGRQILSNHLESIAHQYEEDLVLVNEVLFKRHELGTVEYHSLCGSMKVTQQYTYRQAGVHNGPTVVPMELKAGLIERATPALVFRAALGDAQCPSRQWEEQLYASHRKPPSRSTLERIAQRIGDTVGETAPEILPFVRDEK
jgi:hypothetical protein